MTRQTNRAPLPEIHGVTMRSVRPLAYPVAEAAAMIGVCRSTLYKLFDEGKLASIKIGKRRLVAHAEIERLLATHQVEG